MTIEHIAMKVVVTALLLLLGTTVAGGIFINNPEVQRVIVCVACGLTATALSGLLVVIWS